MVQLKHETFYASSSDSAVSTVTYKHNLIKQLVQRTGEKSQFRQKSFSLWRLK